MRCIVYSPYWLRTILPFVVKSAFYIRTQAWGFRRCSFRQLGRCQSLYTVERVTGLAPRFHVYILEKARVFAPFGHAGLPPFGMIRLTPPGKIKMTPVDDTAGEFFCSFENPCPGTAGFNIKNYKYDCKIKKHPEMLRSWNGNKRDGQYVSHFPQHSAQVCPAVHFKRQADRATA